MPGSNDHDHYVRNADWLLAPGRDDLIDEIADQHERRLCPTCAPEPEPRLPRAG